MAQQLQLAGTVEAPAWDCSDFTAALCHPTLVKYFSVKLSAKQKFAQLRSSSRAANSWLWMLTAQGARGLIFLHSALI